MQGTANANRYTMEFSENKINPSDLIDATATIPVGRFVTCDWLESWTPATTYLKCARQGLKDGSKCGLLNAISNAKRAVCSRIDMLILYNHLRAFSKKRYPGKIDALRGIGLDVPSVIYELVVGPRNELEHQYKVPDGVAAKHAVEIGELFISATNSERKQNSIIFGGYNILSKHVGDADREFVEVQGFQKGTTMLFIDVFESPPVAKVVDPESGEVRICGLSCLTGDQNVEFAKLLRMNRSCVDRYETGYPRSTCIELKRASGI